MTTGTAMASIITSVGTVVTAGISWMGSYVTAITSSGNEIILLFVCFPLIGAGIGLLKRMISL